MFAYVRASRVWFIPVYAKRVSDSLEDIADKEFHLFIFIYLFNLIIEQWIFDLLSLPYYNNCFNEKTT